MSTDFDTGPQEQVIKQHPPESPHDVSGYCALAVHILISPTKVIVNQITTHCMPLSKTVAFGGPDFLAPRKVPALPGWLSALHIQYHKIG